MMKKAGLAALCILAGWAASGTPIAASTDSVPGSMPTGKFTSQPIGHKNFCRRHRSECWIISRHLAPPVLLDAPMFRQLSSVTSVVNRTVTAASDKKMHGTADYWSYPVNGRGDCEDYVLLKRDMLRMKGIAISNLLITVVKKKDGEGHAVLTIRTNMGDYVLDNLNNEVKPWAKTGYKFIKRQSNVNTGKWVSILGEEEVPVVGAAG